MKISEINFDPRWSSQELAFAISWLEQSSPRFNKTANFCIVGTQTVGNGMEVVHENHIGRVCHRYIKDTTFNARSLVATECGWKRAGHSVDLITPFFRWLTEESLYHKFIVWSDIYRGFVVSADVYAPLMQNIMIITRHFYEGSKLSFERFNKLVDLGVPGNIAYVFAFNSSLRSSQENAKFISACNHTVSHVFDLPSFQNFVDGELGPSFDASEERHYRNDTNYSGGYLLFWQVVSTVPSFNIYTYDPGLVSALMTKEEFRNELAEYRKGKQVAAYAAPNPFAPKSSVAPTLAPNEVTVGEAIEVVAPFLGKILCHNTRKES